MFKVWPNKMGFDVGDAEVRVLSDKLRAFVPTKAKLGRSVRDGKFIRTERFRVMDFSMSTRPETCVEVCRAIGKVVEDGERVSPVPFYDGFREQASADAPKGARLLPSTPGPSEMGGPGLFDPEDDLG